MKLKINESYKKIFFTSDPHYYHDNIIKYCNRPFKNAKEMNEKLIRNWNSVVPIDGHTIVGGDFAMTSNIELITNVISRLNGHIYLTFGNHDYQNRLDRSVIASKFDKVSDVFDLTISDSELDDGKINFFISHYPHLFWPKHSINLHGHIHSGPKSTAKEVDVNKKAMRYDIGVDNNNYYPISYEDLKIKLTKKLGGFK